MTDVLRKNIVLDFLKSLSLLYWLNFECEELTFEIMLPFIFMLLCATLFLLEFMLPIPIYINFLSLSA